MPFDGLSGFPAAVIADIPRRYFQVSQGRITANRRLDAALNDVGDYRYIGLNNSYVEHATAVDCDTDEWKKYFRNGEWTTPPGCVAVPPPNVIVENTDRPGAHLIWFHLAAFLRQPGSRPKVDMTSWCRQIQSGLTTLLCGDHAFRSSGLVKNPLYEGIDPFGKPSPGWRRRILHDHIYDLHEFDTVKKHARLKWKNTPDVTVIAADIAASETAAEPSQTVSGRNDYMFDLLRFHAYRCYDAAYSHADYVELLRQAVPGYRAEVIDRFGQKNHPFTSAEIERTICQIARYMTTRYQPSESQRERRNINRGVMQLAHTGMARREKQRMAAGRTNGLHRERSQVGLGEYLRSHLGATTRMIADAFLVSVRTAQRWIATLRRGSFASLLRAKRASASSCVEDASAAGRDATVIHTVCPGQAAPPYETPLVAVADGDIAGGNNVVEEPRRQTKKARAGEIRQRIVKRLPNLSPPSQMAEPQPSQRRPDDGDFFDQFGFGGAKNVDTELPKTKSRSPTFEHAGKTYTIHPSGAIGYWRRSRGAPKSVFIEVPDPRPKNEKPQRELSPLTQRIQEALIRRGILRGEDG